MAKLTKTELKVRIARAEQGIALMTVLMQHVNNNDFEAIKVFGQSWLTQYTQWLEELKAQEAGA